MTPWIHGTLIQEPTPKEPVARVLAVGLGHVKALDGRWVPLHCITKQRRVVVQIPVYPQYHPQILTSTTARPYHQRPDRDGRWLPSEHPCRGT